MIYIAHKCEEKQNSEVREQSIKEHSEVREQSIKEHSEVRADLCTSFCAEPWTDFFYNIALFHDIGKYQESFQKRIRGNKKIKAPHSFCGAKTSKQEFGSKGVAIISQYVIAGHHSGLHDIGNKKDTEDKGTLYGNIARQSENYDEYKNDIIIRSVDFNKLNNYISNGCATQDELSGRFAFITRYCFSCLTDADWLNTERFVTQKEREKVTSDFAECLKKLNEKLEKFTAVTQLQKARSKIQLQAYKKINDSSSVYLMNMPTGSGKTLCSMKFALEKALLRGSGKKRIIYIIPYNSIIEQTAKTFEDIFK
ncbi:MAG: CRISPR-associated endonuclease Cas3'', partial [Oscillospiraceae bacterium]